MSCYGCMFYKERAVPNKDNTIMTVQRMCMFKSKKGFVLYDSEFLSRCRKYMKQISS